MKIVLLIQVISINFPKILSFDFHHNGMTQVLPPKKQREALITAFDNLGSSAAWRAQQVYYVLVPKVKERAFLFTCAGCKQQRD